jgi:hypothetical protein
VSPRRRHRVALAAVIGLGLGAVAGCGGSEPTSVTPGLPSSAPATTARPGSSGATVVLPKGTSPPGSNPTPAGGTVPETGRGGVHGGGGSSSGQPGDPDIGAITVPNPLRCDVEGPAAATLDYRTAGADRVVLLVDGQQLPGLAPQSGPVTVTLPCDGATHVLVIAAVGPSGASTIDSRIVLSEVGGTSELRTGG